jgi:hypothetical protein
MMIPTNEEIERNAPDTVREALKHWLIRHPTPPAGVVDRQRWFDWAADNLLNDPEIRGAWKKEHNSE